MTAPDPPIPVHPTAEVIDGRLWLRVAVPGREPEWFRLQADKQVQPKPLGRNELETRYQARQNPVVA